MAETEKKRGGKLQLGKIASQEVGTLVLGTNATETSLRTLPVPTGVTVLGVGHGVPHIARFFETVLAHYRKFQVPIYGIDFFPMLDDFSKQLFAAKPVRQADNGIKLIDRLIQADDPVVLLITRADVAFREEQDGEGELGPFAQAVIRAAEAPNVSLFMTAYESAKESDLPERVLEAFERRIGLGKLLSTESARIYSAAEVKAGHEASQRHSLLAGTGVFQHDRPVFTEEFQVRTPGVSRYL